MKEKQWVLRSASQAKMVHHAYCYETTQKKKKKLLQGNKTSIMHWSRSPGSLQRAEKATATVVRDEAHGAEGVNDELPVTSGK